MPGAVQLHAAAGIVATLPILPASQPRYANNQHRLGSEISDDPKETSFFKAMQLSEGVLIVPAAV